MAKFYYSIFKLVVLTLIVYFGIDSFYRVMRAHMDQADREDIMIHGIEDGKRNEQLSLTDYNVIRSRNIFSKVDKSPAKEILFTV